MKATRGRRSWTRNLVATIVRKRVSTMLMRSARLSRSTQKEVKVAVVIMKVTRPTWFT